MRDVFLAKFLKISAIVIFFGAILTFAFVKTKDLLLGTSLTITGLDKHGRYETPVLFIEGLAERAKILTINGEQIFLDPAGNFRDWRLLLPGFNQITVTAHDRFGKEKTKVFEVVYNKL